MRLIQQRLIYMRGYKRVYKCKRYGIKKHRVESCKKKWWIGIENLAAMEICSSETDSIANIAINNLLLWKFLRTFSYFFVLPRHPIHSDSTLERHPNLLQLQPQLSEKYAAYSPKSNNACEKRSEVFVETRRSYQLITFSTSSL